ncbi:MAG: hypothetical protein HQM16_19400, partial [Deltaproteobacteria bacterium]|nr:hypothetical protein [Deltaproteobacteria bacterium]
MKKNDAPVYITGLGALHCLGVGVPSLWQGVIQRQTGIKNGLGLITDEALAKTEPLLQDSPFKKTSRALYQDPKKHRPLIMSLVAIREAFLQAGWDQLSNKDAIIFATTTGYISLWEDHLTSYSQG